MRPGPRFQIRRPPARRNVVVLRPITLVPSRIAVIAAAVLFALGMVFAARDATLADDGWASPAEARSIWWAFGTTGVLAVAVVVHLLVRDRARRRGAALRGLSTDLWVVLGGGGAVALAAGAIGIRNQDRGPGFLVIGVLGMLLYILLWLVPLILFALWLSFPVWLRACWRLFGPWGVVAGAALMVGVYCFGFAAAFPLTWLWIAGGCLLGSGLLGVAGLALTISGSAPPIGR